MPLIDSSSTKPLFHPYSHANWKWWKQSSATMECQRRRRHLTMSTRSRRRPGCVAARAQSAVSSHRWSYLHASQLNSDPHLRALLLSRRGEGSCSKNQVETSERREACHRRQWKMSNRRRTAAAAQGGEEKAVMTHSVQAELGVRARGAVKKSKRR